MSSVNILNYTYLTVCLRRYILICGADMATIGVFVYIEVRLLIPMSIITIVFVTVLSGRKNPRRRDAENAT